MNVNGEYRRKLTSAEAAIEVVKSGDTIIHGTSIAEPPALLTALADRVRRGGLSGLKTYSSLAMAYASRFQGQPVEGRGGYVFTVIRTA